MALILKAIGGVTALVLVAITLLGSLIALGGFLLTAIKALIVVIFFTLIAMVLFSILRKRSDRRSESRDF